MIRERWMRGAVTLATIGLMGGCGQLDENSESALDVTPVGDAVRATPSRTLSADTRFYVPPPSAGSSDQIKALKKAKKKSDAALIAAMEETPRGVWFRRDAGRGEDRRQEDDGSGGLRGSGAGRLQPAVP